MITKPAWREERSCPRLPSASILPSRKFYCLNISKSQPIMQTPKLGFSSVVDRPAAPPPLGITSWNSPLQPSWWAPSSSLLLFPQAV